MDPERIAALRARAGQIKHLPTKGQRVREERATTQRRVLNQGSLVDNAEMWEEGRNPDDVDPSPLQILAEIATPTELEVALPSDDPRRHFVPQAFPPWILDEDERQQVLIHQVFALYLRGYPREAIAEKLRISRSLVRTCLGRARKSIVQYMKENPEIFGAPMEALYLQVLRRRQRQAALWEEIEEAGSEQVRPQYYRLIAEEDKAVESLLGLTSEHIKITLGSPIEQAQADLLRSLGPEALRQLMSEIRETHLAATGIEAFEVIDGEVIDAPITDQTRFDRESPSSTSGPSPNSGPNSDAR